VGGVGIKIPPKRGLETIRMEILTKFLERQHIKDGPSRHCTNYYNCSH